MSYSAQEIRKARLDRFPVFLALVWRFLGLPKPTIVQRDIAKWLHNPGTDRLVLSAFRGVGKTWITVAFVLWCLFLNPELKIMVVSATKQSADQFSSFAKSLIHGMPLLRHLAARPDQDDRSDYWFVGPAGHSKDPSVKSIGINGQLTGSRADIIIFDDVEIPNNAQTFLLRQKLAERVTEGADVLKPDGLIIYLGTPQVEESLYAKLVRERGYSMRVWPAEIPSKPENYHGRLAPMIQAMMDAGVKPGTPTDPVRFDEEELAKRRLEKGAAGFALQFMLDVNPSEAEKRPLKLRNLIILPHVDPDMGHTKLLWSSEQQYMVKNLTPGGFDGDYYVNPFDRSKEMEKYGGTVMAIDPSGMGSDETAYAIVRYCQGMLYLVEVGGFLDGFGIPTLEKIAERAAFHKVNFIIDEVNYGGGMFRSLLKPHVASAFLAAGIRGGAFDEEYDGWSRGQKELRILDTLEPILASHRLVVDQKVIEADLPIQMKTEAYSFVWQMTRMERTKGALPHEDRLEAVAMACSYWTSRMDRDRDRALAMHREKAMQAELRKFKNTAFHIGKKPTRVGSPKTGLWN